MPSWCGTAISSSLWGTDSFSSPTFLPRKVVSMSILFTNTIKQFFFVNVRVCPKVYVHLAVSKRE